MKIRNLAAFTLAALLGTQATWAQDEDVEAQEDPFRERERHKDEDDEQSEDEEAEDDGESADRSFGNSSEVVVSAERLLTFGRTARSWKLDGVEQKSTVDRAHLLVGGGGDPVGYSTPRVAFDFFASDGFSLGLALGYSADSGEFDDTLFLASPRAGYALMFGKVVGVWPRLGITFQDQKTSGNKITLLTASMELPVVIVPTHHVALTLGPTLDLSIIGKINPEGPIKKTDFSAHEVGFSTGMSIFF
jgi:hypothetical protein